MIIQGAASRLRPIFLTSLTTLGGLFPMAYAIGGDAGFTRMLAMSMGWGILFATFLTLFLLPCFIMVQRDCIALFHRLIKIKAKPIKVNISKDVEIESEINPVLPNITKPEESEDRIH